MKKKYTDEEFKEAVKNSFSIAQVLKKLGLIQAGGNYNTFHFNIKRLKLTTTHFLGQGHLKGKHHNWGNKIKIEDILIENSNYSSHRLKNRLIKNGHFEHKCDKCSLREWQGQKISLELEHKNGNHFDNRIDNLILLCPNCHSQTSSYRGKNISKK